MKCSSDKISNNHKCLRVRPAFSLIEAMTALIILALVTSSVMVVINRSIESASDSIWRNRAFKVARENMEMLLSADSVSETIEYGQSEKYPQIYWETTIEPFYEPSTSRMWMKAVCLAEYIDTQGEPQKVELLHWLTNLSKEQMLQMLNLAENIEVDQLIETIEEAAGYAGVDENTIRQWVDNGMLVTAKGYYIKDWLDLYEETDGEPTAKEKNILIEKMNKEKQEQIIDSKTDQFDEISEENLSPEEMRELIGGR